MVRMVRSLADRTFQLWYLPVPPHVEERPGLLEGPLAAALLQDALGPDAEEQPLDGKDACVERCVQVPETNYA